MGRETASVWRRDNAALPALQRIARKNKTDISQAHGGAAPGADPISVSLSTFRDQIRGADTPENLLRRVCKLLLQQGAHIQS